MTGPFNQQVAFSAYLSDDAVLLCSISAETYESRFIVKVKYVFIYGMCQMSLHI